MYFTRKAESIQSKEKLVNRKIWHVYREKFYVNNSLK